jgi:cytochrome c oxidase assembly protein subunit 15
MKYSKAVIFWLYLGLFMVFMQIVIGGITRLTGSGLSITKWEIVTGTLPPLNQAKWDSEFKLYKATPQYQKINQGMTMRQFKFIYFWEYLHRLWARTMGFVFLFPFLYFLWRKRIDKPLIFDLLKVVFFAGLAAVFGWIMVASGLINRPWVNAYKLSIHLLIGFAVFGAMWWTVLNAHFIDQKSTVDKTLHKPAFLFITLLIMQIFFGGMMSGMKAGLFYPTWPLIDGSFLPSVIFNTSEWNVDNFNNYDQSSFMSALVQSIHRIIAYALFIYGIMVAFKFIRIEMKRPPIYLFFSLLVLQVILGILTLINCVGSIPVTLGVLHQIGAILLFASALYLLFVSSRRYST